MTAGRTLRSVLDEALEPHGFVCARGSRRWHRAAGEREQWVGLRRSRTGEGSSALCIAEQVPGAEAERSFEPDTLAQVRDEYRASMTGNA